MYEARFDMARFRSGNPGRDGVQLAPLYITESLTPRNRLLYEELLRAKRPENGGLIASVFSRRGGVWCRTEKGGANLRVQDEGSLRRILGGRRFLGQPRAPGRGAPLQPPSSAARRPPAPAANAGRSARRRAAAPPGSVGDSEGVALLRIWRTRHLQRIPVRRARSRGGRRRADRLARARCRPSCQPLPGRESSRRLAALVWSCRCNVEVINSMVRVDAESEVSV